MTEVNYTPAMVAAIATGLDLDSLDGLEKATGAALNKLLSAIK